MKLLTVIGARPQIIKAAAISRAIANGFPTKWKSVSCIPDNIMMPICHRSSSTNWAFHSPTTILRWVPAVMVYRQRR